MSEVAQRAGLSQQMVSYVERQLRNPTLDTMLRLADALEINATDMLRAAHQNTRAPSSSTGKKMPSKKNEPVSHRFIPALGEATPALNPEHTAAIKRWTHDILRLPEDAVVTVNEIPCADTGCPLVETAVAVFDTTGTRLWKFTRPRVAVTKLMLQQTLATPPDAPASKPSIPGGISRPSV